MGIGVPSVVYTYSNTHDNTTRVVPFQGMKQTRSPAGPYDHLPTQGTPKLQRGAVVAVGRGALVAVAMAVGDRVAVGAGLGVGRAVGVRVAVELGDGSPPPPPSPSRRRRRSSIHIVWRRGEPSPM